eukprot:459809-Pleurochrysis_carterae.AAC.1
MEVNGEAVEKTRSGADPMQSAETDGYSAQELALREELLLKSGRAAAKEHVRKLKQRRLGAEGEAQARREDARWAEQATTTAPPPTACWLLAPLVDADASARAEETSGGEIDMALVRATLDACAECAWPTIASLQALYAQPDQHGA